MSGPSRRWRRLRRAVALLLAAIALGLAIPNAWILLGTARHIVAIDGAPTRPVAIVLGASVRRDGAPSGILADRLDVAIALHRNGRVDKVLVSGDRDYEREYDEVGVMARYLQAHGVPAAAILVDPHGYRTYDSMWRARRVSGIDRALVVTNAFHLPRAVWTGRQLGIDCVGVAPPVSSRLAWRRWLRNVGREALARVAAVLDVIAGTEPAVLTGTQPR